MGAGPLKCAANRPMNWVQGYGWLCSTRPKDGAQMVPLTRFSGLPFALNPDLIERVDETPDTVITLVDGTKYLVRESLADVVSLVMDYRARLLAAAGQMENATPGDLADRSAARRSRLTAVPGPDDGRQHDRHNGHGAHDDQDHHQPATPRQER
jgi:flagellar protein FlbD